MTIAEIKEAINAGKRVCWSNPAYNVIKDSKGQYLIECSFNGHCIGLTNLAGDRLNGNEDEFFVR